MITDWSELKFWNSGECQVTQERLNDYEKHGVHYNPARFNLFKALHLTPYTKVKVAIIGQDPYPNAAHATGIAFSIPKDCREYPPTLENIFIEYSDVHGDLRYPYPTSGCLEKWCSEGVLLWNAYPTCFSNQPGSHRWVEWETLTSELVEELNDKETLLVSFGAVAWNFIKHCNNVLSVSHPSPLGYKKGRTPFHGSRVFSTINGRLCDKGIEPINWRLT